MLDAFLSEFGLHNDEGVALMCLAESLLRVPDPQTADELIADKLGPAHWDEHLGHSGSLLVNASTWALMLTGRAVSMGRFEDKSGGAVLQSLAGRLGEPVIRAAVRQAMSILGQEIRDGRDHGSGHQARLQDGRQRRVLLRYSRRRSAHGTGRRGLFPGLPRGHSHGGAKPGGRTPHADPACQSS